jgi:hypothetical protein
MKMRNETCGGVSGATGRGKIGVLGAMVLMMGLVLLAGMGGCQALGFIAAGLEEGGSKRVPALYDRLNGKSYAVLVNAPPVIMASDGMRLAEMNVALAETLKDRVKASGYVPGSSSVEFTTNRPSWHLQPMGLIARDLGVDRLIVVEVEEYRLTDPRNQYIFDGVAAATVRVYERESIAPDEPTFTRAIRVKFPDVEGSTATVSGQDIIETTLAARLSQRILWMFHEHEEPNDLKY